MFDPAPAEEPTATPLADIFVPLRIRYMRLRDTELTADEVDLWMAHMYSVFMDVRRSPFTIAEVTHP